MNFGRVTSSQCVLEIFSNGGKSYFPKLKLCAAALDDEPIEGKEQYKMTYLIRLHFETIKIIAINYGIIGDDNLFCNLPDSPPPNPPAVKNKFKYLKLQLITFMRWSLPLKLWLAALAELPLAPPGPPALNVCALKSIDTNQSMFQELKTLLITSCISWTCA